MPTRHSIAEVIQRARNTVPSSEHYSVHVGYCYFVKAQGEKGNLKLPNWSLLLEGKFNEGQLGPVTIFFCY